MITIIDYGMGNLGSVKNMFKKIGVESIVTSNIIDIKNAEKLVLPGVGSFDQAMNNLDELNLIDIIKEKVINDKIPILGICLGMQLLTKESEEGEKKGFGFIDAYAKKFNFTQIKKTLNIPHMGWNRVFLKKSSRLFSDMPENSRFYFVHSYAVEVEKEKEKLTVTNYGKEFVSSFEANNVLGVQYHPEKSHKFGMRLFKNFAENY